MNWEGFEMLKVYVEERIREFDRIPVERQEALIQLAARIKGDLDSRGQTQLIFICTHNSRRSHMGHLWAQLAATYYKAGAVSCYSGGTEATAFNPRAVQALVEAGMQISKLNEQENPVYRVALPGHSEANELFSKKYSDPPNPTSDFIAVMTCSDADEACPIVYGAASRHAIRYEDPKTYDGTGEESVRYRDRSQQIAREMFFLFSKV